MSEDGVLKLNEVFKFTEIFFSWQEKEFYDWKKV